MSFILQNAWSDVTDHNQEIISQFTSKEIYIVRAFFGTFNQKKCLGNQEFVNSPSLYHLGELTRACKTTLINAITKIVDLGIVEKYKKIKTNGKKELYNTYRVCVEQFNLFIKTKSTINLFKKQKNTEEQKVEENLDNLQQKVDKLREEAKLKTDQDTINNTQINQQDELSIDEINDLIQYSRYDDYANYEFDDIYADEMVETKVEQQEFNQVEQEKVVQCATEIHYSNELHLFFEKLQFSSQKPFVITQHIAEKIKKFDLNLQTFIQSNQIDETTLDIAYRKMINSKNGFYLSRFLRFDNNCFFDEFNTILNLQDEKIDWDDNSWTNL